ncbi:hypothetical protein V8C42DRAFT_324315 [Trichoderma barbatum]
MRFASASIVLTHAVLISGIHSLAVDSPVNPYPIPASPSNCVPTVTITTRPGISEGCTFNCSNDFCIRDEFVTLPCGCSQAAGVVTNTVTACATSSPCWNCHTGFPFTTTATDCPEPTSEN